MTNPIRCRSVAVPLPLRSIERSNDRTTPPPLPHVDPWRWSWWWGWLIGSAAGRAWLTGMVWHRAKPDVRTVVGIVVVLLDEVARHVAVPAFRIWTDGRRMEDAWKTHGRRMDTDSCCTMHAIEAWKTHGRRMGTDSCCPPSPPNFLITRRVVV